jgi:hypothetical protein
MTLSHEPWLVLPSRRLGVHGNHVKCRLRICGETAWFRGRVLPSRCIADLAVSLRRLNVVGISLAEVASPAGYLAFPKLASFLDRMIDPGIGVRAIGLPLRSARSRTSAKRKSAGRFQGGKTRTFSASLRGLANA